MNDYYAKYILREIRNDGQAEKMKKIDCDSLDMSREKITLILLSKNSWNKKSMKGRPKVNWISMKDTGACGVIDDTVKKRRDERTRYE